jgi:hypothetical protein
LLSSAVDNKIVYAQNKQLKTIAAIAVSTKYKDKEGNIEAEDGLLGLNKDPILRQPLDLFILFDQ